MVEPRFAEVIDEEPAVASPDEGQDPARPEGKSYEEAFDDVAKDLFGKESADEKPTRQKKERTQAKGQKDAPKKGDTKDGEEDPFRAEQFREKEKERDTSGDSLPETWGEDKREIWAAIPEAARKAIRDYESGRKRITDKAVQEAHAAERHYQEQAAPFKRFLENPQVSNIVKGWARNRIHMADGILQAVTTFNDLRQDLSKPETSIEVIQEIMARHQITPQQLSGASSQVNGANRELLDRVESLTNEVAELRGGREADATRVQAERSQEAFGIYQQFENTKNAFGEIKYPAASNPRVGAFLGSEAKRLMAVVPGITPQQALARAYAEAGFPIQTGSASSSNRTERLRNAATTAYNRGRSPSREQTKMGVDDAFEATFEEFGMLPD